jgi:hypothetical protein
MAPWSGRLLTLAAVMFGLWIAQLGWRKRHSETPHCPRCRYNLTGASSAACPECGYEPADRKAVHRLPRRRWLIAVGLIVAMAMPAFVVQRRVRAFGWGYYLTLYPLYAVFPREHLIDVCFDHGIHVVVWRDRRSFLNRGDGIIVSSNGHTVWTAGHEGYWTIGSPNTGKGGQHQLIDLDGNGSKELIVTSNHGGTGSDDHIRILSFNVARPVPWGVGRAKIVGFGDFVDVDGDGRYEFEYTSNYYRYRWTSGGGSPYPTVWLTFRDGAFHFDEQHSRHPLPDYAAQIDALDYALSNGGEPHGKALRLAMKMIYAGHMREGITLLERIDPIFAQQRYGGAAPLSQQVLAAIADAPFGRGILAMNRADSHAAAAQVETSP